MKSVLIVMDDPLLAGLIEYKLEKSGFNVSMAEDGQQALEILHLETFDAMVLDVMLPKMDGFRLMHELKKPGVAPPGAIVILSARAAEEDMLRAFELGAVDYIVKPFSLNVLVKRIEIALGYKAASGPAVTAGPAKTAAPARAVM